MKRVLDVVVSALGLVLALPVLLPVMLLVWLQDRHSPFYIAPRIGRGGGTFRMVKLRSMVVNADRSGVDSTSAADPRITAIGRFIRRYKLDEVTQLWNVLTGDMSLVGPRPNVRRGTDQYTEVERGLLSVRPGITDFASIVFSDEGEILRDSADPDLDYNRLIRPWKSRMGLVYVAHASVLLDIRLIALTLLSLASRPAALTSVARILQDLGADAALVDVASRRAPLNPAPPPGGDHVLTTG